MKDYTQPYATPYYDELKRKGIRLPAFLTHIRTDAARIEKPKDARMFRMLFLTPRTDGCCGTIDTRPMSNVLMTYNMDTRFQRTENSQEWFTPPRLMECLGAFDLDPCAPSKSFYTAKECYTEEEDGLTQPWFGRVWLNPPYRNPLIGKFIRRMNAHNNGIALIFNRMDTHLWHDEIFPNATAMLVMRGRVRFHRPDGTEADSAGCGSVLVAWGPDNAKTLRKCGIDGKFISLKNRFT